MTASKHNVLHIAPGGLAKLPRLRWNGSVAGVKVVHDAAHLRKSSSDIGTTREGSRMDLEEAALRYRVAKEKLTLAEENERETRRALEAEGVGAVDALRAARQELGRAGEELAAAAMEHRIHSDV